MSALATVSTAVIGQRDVAQRGRGHFIKGNVANKGFFLSFVLGIVVYVGGGTARQFERTISVYFVCK